LRSRFFAAPSHFFLAMRAGPTYSVYNIILHRFAFAVGMKRYATTSWARFLAAALLAWLAQGAVAPSAVRASCGDYVTGSSREGETTPSQQPPAPPRPCPGNITPCRERVSGEALPGGQVPCRGPGCSGNPVPTPEPLTTVSP